jgi:hypothetical protein
MQPAPAVATEFELQVRQLRLTVETYVFSAELRNRCERNRNRFYITFQNGCLTRGIYRQIQTSPMQ